MNPEEIRKLRQYIGCTQADMAKMLGVTFQTYNRWERGHHRPTGLYRLRLESIWRVFKKNIPSK